MRKVLIIGGNGFIGSHLVDRYVDLGWDTRVLDLYERRYSSIPEKVRFIKGDISQEYIVREALTGVDLVYHLAWTSIHEISNQNPGADITNNLLPAINLMSACQSAGVERLVFTSSGGTVYGIPKQLPIREGHPTSPISSYGITKLAVEKYLYMFKRLFDLDYIVLRPSVPYGPRQNPLGRQGAVAVFLYRVASRIPIQIWGDGSTTRDFFYISDLIDALVACRELDSGGDRVYNIGGQEEISLSQLISHIEETVEQDALIEYKQIRAFDPQRILLDTSLAQSRLNWQPKVNIRQGLKQTWNWMSNVIQDEDSSP